MHPVHCMMSVPIPEQKYTGVSLNVVDTARFCTAIFLCLPPAGLCGLKGFENADRNMKESCGYMCSPVTVESRISVVAGNTCRLTSLTSTPTQWHPYIHTCDSAAMASRIARVLRHEATIKNGDKFPLQRWIFGGSMGNT